MPTQRIRDFLDRHGVKYVAISHSPAFTAQEIAAATHIPGRELAKTVMVKLDGRMVMAVLPASARVNLSKLADATGSKHSELATEDEFKHLFPGCEVGAMPPFGNLWKVPVYVSESLAGDENISFNAGTHTEVISIRFDDFFGLVGPRLIEFSER